MGVETEGEGIPATLVSEYTKYLENSNAIENESTRKRAECLPLKQSYVECWGFGFQN